MWRVLVTAVNLPMSVCADKQTKEASVAESSSSHCFNDLGSETLYRISVHSLLGSAEGAAVSILHPTGLISCTNCRKADPCFYVHFIPKSFAYNVWEMCLYVWIDPFLAECFIIDQTSFSATAPARIPTHPRKYPVHNEGDLWPAQDVSSSERLFSSS